MDLLCPSGLFRAHVDIPRSTSHIGSLAVCLPSPFKGGNLIIRHRGRGVGYDWSRESTSAIQWAAFYSGCEHEIKEVTEGQVQIAEDKFRLDARKNITWLTEQKDEEMAFSHLAYGNEVEIAIRYSCAAILANIPKWGECGELGQHAGSVA